MKIAIGNDHAGVPEKESIKTHLENAGHTVINVGTDTTDSTDYPEYGHRVGEQVSTGEADFGILVCGTGIGISMAANKVTGVRAAVSHSVDTAHLAREHNDANVLCMGARILSIEEMLAQVEEFLSTPFAGGRHQLRVEKIESA